MKAKLFFIAILSFLFAINVFSQDEVKKANKYYNSYDYDKAIKAYEAVYYKPASVNRKLAECYRYLDNTEKSEEYYAAVVNSEEKQPSDVFYYASMLRCNKKYDESDKWMTEFHNLVQEDSRGVEYASNQGFFSELLKDRGRFEIIKFDNNSSAEDFGPAFYKGKLLFASSREGKKKWNWNRLPFLDTYVSDFEMENISKYDHNINKKYHDGPVNFSENGKVMAFTTNNYSSKSSDDIRKLKLYYSDFVDGSWSAPKSIHFNNAEYSVGHPSLTPDGNTMYFASDMPGGKGGVDIYKVKRNGDGTWGSPENLGDKINTEGNEMFPFYHPSGYLFFASNGHVGLGGLDLFIAKFLNDGEISDTEIFGLKNMESPINTNKDDFGLIMDEKMRMGFFSSNRPGGKGSDDIYGFKYLKPFDFGKIIQGIVRDKKGNILSNVNVELKDKAGKSYGTVVTGADGFYKFYVKNSKKTYDLDGTKKGYTNDFKNPDTDTPIDIIIADLNLVKNPEISLFGVVTDKMTKKPLKDVNVTLIDENLISKLTFVTPNTGDFRTKLEKAKLNDKGNFKVILSKTGYITKKLNYVKIFDRPGQYDINADLALELETEDIFFGPIYFDFDKYNIRPDAEAELQRILSWMNSHPNAKLEMSSYTDARAPNSYNVTLSKNRYKSTYQWLVNHGISSDRLSGMGKSETNLTNNCDCDTLNNCPCDEAQHQMNRRTEFRVVH